MSEDEKSAVAKPEPSRFRRYRPSVLLSPFVRNYWTLRFDRAASTAGHQRVVPDGCIDIILARHSPTEQYRASIVGTMTRPVLEELAGHVDYVGIRFAAGGFRRFFDIPAGELTDRIVPLDDVAGFLPVEQVAGCADTPWRVRTIEDALRRRLVSGKPDATLAGVLAAISAARGNASIEELARLAGCSPRHLHRLFVDAVGAGPRVFCKVVRFQHALRALRQSRRPDLLGIALDAGYYDQAHFIHDFNRFYGASPSTVGKDPAF